MGISTGLSRFLAPQCATTRLRICYYSALAALAVTLLVSHGLAVREHREARLLAVATHVCQLSAGLPVVFVHVPPAPQAAVNSNIRRAVAPAQEK